jgi:predicted DNA-binding protein
MLGGMASPITLRLDPELRRRVTRIARRKRTTTSTVLREAITTWVEREESAGSLYESIKDLIGNVRGNDPTLSTDTGRKFTELLKARRERS